MQSLEDQSKSTKTREPEENLKEECTPYRQVYRSTGLLGPWCPLLLRKIIFNCGIFHTDAFVATTNIVGFTIHNILIDNGSSADILFIKPFE